MKINNFKQFLREARQAVKSADAFVEKHQLRDQVLADHICFKCSSSREFERMRRLIEPESKFVFQSWISKRRIAYIRLQTGIPTDNLAPIHFIELSDQKPDRSQKSGFDHLEVYPPSISYRELVEDLAKMEKVKHEKRPHHSTHGIVLGGGFIFRLTTEPLLTKIMREEMF